MDSFQFNSESIQDNSSPILTTNLFQTGSLLSPRARPRVGGGREGKQPMNTMPQAQSHSMTVSGDNLVYFDVRDPVVEVGLSDPDAIVCRSPAILCLDDSRTQVVGVESQVTKIFQGKPESIDEINTRARRGRKSDETNFACLVGQEWLGDNVFMCVLQLIAHQGGWGLGSAPPSQGVDVWCADTYFVDIIRNRGSEDCKLLMGSMSGITGKNREWDQLLSDLKITPAQFQDMVRRARSVRYAIIPVHVACHWYYGVVDFSDEYIDLVNSYGTKSSDVHNENSWVGMFTRLLLRWVMEVQECRGESPRRFRVRYQSVRTQQGWTECGLHTIGGMMARVCGHQNTGVTDEFSLFLRRWFAILLWVTGELSIKVPLSMYKKCPSFLRSSVRCQHSPSDGDLYCICTPDPSPTSVTEILDYIRMNLKSRCVSTVHEECYIMGVLHVPTGREPGDGQEEVVRMEIDDDDDPDKTTRYACYPDILVCWSGYTFSCL